MTVVHAGPSYFQLDTEIEELKTVWKNFIVKKVMGKISKPLVTPSTLSMHYSQFLCITPNGKLFAIVFLPFFKELYACCLRLHRILLSEMIGARNNEEVMVFPGKSALNNCKSGIEDGGSMLMKLEQFLPLLQLSVSSPSKYLHWVP